MTSTNINHILLIQRLTVGVIEETLLQEFPGAVLMGEAGEALEAFPAEIDAIASG